MCHEHTGRAWNREYTDEDAEEDQPSFLNEEGGDDVEVLTDGGDES